jgi:hypothetical protein
VTREDIIRMAREAGFSDTTNPFVAWGASWEQVERFAALVAAAEREACAKVCDAVQKKNEDDGAWMWEARNCAAAIRSRGQQ